MLRLFSKPKPEPGPRPRAARDEIACSATLCDGKKFHRVKLCDVSKSGCKVRLPTPIQAGERVQIALEAYHSLGGTIRWCREGMAGIQFARPMSEAALLTWRNAIAAARPQQGEFAPPGLRKNFLGEWVEDSNRPSLRRECGPTAPNAEEAEQPCGAGEGPPEDASADPAGETHEGGGGSDAAND